MTGAMPGDIPAWSAADPLPADQEDIIARKVAHTQPLSEQDVHQLVLLLTQARLRRLGKIRRQ